MGPEGDPVNGLPVSKRTAPRARPVKKSPKGVAVARGVKGLESSDGTES